MNAPNQPKLKLTQTAEYREGYANSAQMRLSRWDLFIQFGTLHQETAELVEIRNFQGIYLSPQQAKALLHVLTQNVQQYEQAFGEIRIDASADAQGGLVQ